MTRCLYPSEIRTGRRAARTAPTAHNTHSLPDSEFEYNLMFVRQSGLKTAGIAFRNSQTPRNTRSWKGTPSRNSRSGRTSALGRRSTSGARAKPHRKDESQRRITVHYGTYRLTYTIMSRLPGQVNDMSQFHCLPPMIRSHRRRLYAPFLIALCSND